MKAIKSRLRDINPVLLILQILITLGFLLVIVMIGLSIYGYFANEENKISSGTVIDKNYRAAYTSIYYVHSGDLNVPVYQYHSDCYKLELKGEKNGKTVEYWFECTKEEYSDYNIGDHYPKNEKGA